MQSRCIQGPGLFKVTPECTTRRGNWTCRISAENRSGTILHTSGCLLAPPLSDWTYRRFPETYDIVGQQKSLFSSTTRLTIVGKVTRSIFKNSSIWSGWASLTETDVLLVGLGGFFSSWYLHSMEEHLATAHTDGGSVGRSLFHFPRIVVYLSGHSFTQITLSLLIFKFLYGIIFFHSSSLLASRGKRKTLT